MKKVPVSLIIDDPAPIISVFHEHAPSPLTADGRPIIPTFPNSRLFEFCDIIERHGDLVLISSTVWRVFPGKNWTSGWTP